MTAEGMYAGGGMGGGIQEADDPTCTRDKSKEAGRHPLTSNARYMEKVEHFTTYVDANAHTETFKHKEKQK